ncbi:MAG: type I-B CRISPR-associated protein Cas7/Cst2/DevR [Prevotella sp.]|nr:type I-B CRISPR-associated protein Cas7/Cst2/DevR [Prevotella sp.]
MEKNLKTQGFYLVDVDVVALNNAGKSTLSNFDNGIATKTISKNGRTYVYVSGQAFRFWWRNTLQKNLGWILSPVTREGKIAYTNANPLKYGDDDIFGYMRAATEEIEGKDGKVKKQNITVTRVSPLQNSVLVSASAVRPVENWSSMARQEGDSVPYGKQEYSAIMKGMFCLDLNMVGTFSDYNKTGYKNLSEALRKEALDNYGATEINDDFVERKNLVRLPYEKRIERAVETIAALKTIAGGAMQTSNLGDVTPKFIILATTNTGNHPFSHVVTSYGERDEYVKFDENALREVLNEYKETFKGKVFIGRRAGFFNDYDEKIHKIQKDFNGLVEYGPVNAMIDAYCEQLKEQMK